MGRTSASLEYIHRKYLAGSTDHYSLPGGSKRVSYLGRQRTPQWISTCMEHGPPGKNEVPVRTCSLHGCINGKHHIWGSQGDVNATRAMPDQSGEKNPGSKLTSLEVAQLRSVNWRAGYYKKHAAEAAGISMRTLALMLSRYTWKGIEPYRGAEEWASRSATGDEF